MFDHRTAAALQGEKKHRFSKEAETDQARQAGTPSPGLADRLLDVVGRRLVSVGKTLIYDKRSGKAAAVHGSARMVALLAALALSIALAASGSTTEVSDEPVSPVVVEQSWEYSPVDQIEAPDETETKQQLTGGPAGPLTSE